MDSHIKDIQEVINQNYTLEEVDLPISDYEITEEDGIPLNDRVTHVYTITHKPTGDIYIGITWNINERWKTHKYMGTNTDFTHHNQDLYNVMNKEGTDVFDFDHHSTYDNRYLAADVEMQMIKSERQKAIDNGNRWRVFNIDDGGRGGGGFHTVSEEVKDVLSEKHRGENSAIAQLTNEQAEEARQLYVPYKITARAIGELYGVSPDVIKQLLLERSYLNGRKRKYIIKTMTPEQKLKRNEEIINHYKTGEYFQYELAIKYKLSYKQISNILSKISKEEIKKINDSLKPRLIIKFQQSKDSLFKNQEDRDVIKEFRVTINPDTGKHYTTQEIGDIFDVERKTIEDASKDLIFKELQDPFYVNDPRYDFDRAKYDDTEMEKIIKYNFNNPDVSTDDLSKKFGPPKWKIQEIIKKFYRQNLTLIRPERVSPSRGGKSKEERQQGRAKKDKEAKRTFLEESEKKQIIHDYENVIETNIQKVADDRNVSYDSVNDCLKKYFANKNIVMPRYRMGKLIK